MNPLFVMDTNFFLELIGYLASAIIALSMALNSIAWFRIVNLIGAALFSIYGFVIGARWNHECLYRCS